MRRVFDCLKEKAGSGEMKSLLLFPKDRQRKTMLKKRDEEG